MYIKSRDKVCLDSLCDLHLPGQRYPLEVALSPPPRVSHDAAVHLGHGAALEHVVGGAADGQGGVEAGGHAGGGADDLEGVRWDYHGYKTRLLL